MFVKHAVKFLRVLRCSEGFEKTNSSGLISGEWPAFENDYCHVINFRLEDSPSEIRGDLAEF